MSPSRQIVSHSTNIHFSNRRFTLKAFFANSFIFPFPRFITPLEKSPGFTEARFFFIYFEGKWSPAILPKSALCFPAHISCIIQRQYITDAGLAYAGTVDFLSLSCQPSTCANFLAFLPSEKKTGCACWLRRSVTEVLW